jgi:hypothetical protein
LKQKTEASERLQNVRVRDLSKLLKVDEELLRSVGVDRPILISFIEDLIKTLKPIENLDGVKFLEMLKQSLKNYEKLQDSKVTDINVERLGLLHLVELKALISKEELSKSELLVIADKRLGIPVGALKKAKKELIRQRLLTSIDNIQKLDTIRERASK